MTTLEKIPTAQGDKYATSCLLEYNFFNKYQKMIGKDLSFEADPNLMLVQKQYNKLILKEIQPEKEMQIQQCFS